MIREKVHQVCYLKLIRMADCQSDLVDRMCPLFSEVMNISDDKLY